MGSQKDCRLACFLIAVWLFACLGSPALAACNLASAKEHNRLGVTLHSRGKLVEAASQYRLAIGLCPQEAAFHNNLALLLKDQQELAAAAKEARQAVALKPGSANYRFNLGIILEDQGDHAGAVSEFEQACSINPMDGELRYRMGLCLIKANQLKKAEEELRVAVMMSDDRPSYHLALARCLELNDELPAALVEYERAQSLCSGCSEASAIDNQLSDLKEKMGKER